MFFRMLRTQTSEHGTFRMGVAYDAGKNAAQIKAGKAFIAGGLAEEVTAKQLDAEKTKAEKLASAPVKGKKAGTDVAAIKEAQEAAAAAQQETAAAKAAEAAALKEAADAQTRADELAAKVAELEAKAAEKDQSQNSE